MTKCCLTCGVEFSFRPHQAATAKYCSRVCKAKHENALRSERAAIEAERERILALYDWGCGLKRIAKITGFGTTPIRRCLERAGVYNPKREDAVKSWNKGRGGGFNALMAEAWKRELRGHRHFDLNHWGNHILAQRWSERQHYLNRKPKIWSGIKANPSRRMRKYLRSRVYKVLTRYGGFKSAPTLRLLGCTLDQLRRWFEIQFKDGMGWHNQGEWHIDHIIPCSLFDLTDPAQQAQCFHFTKPQTNMGRRQS